MNINIENLSKKFKEHLVLDDINLTLENKQNIAILGPSGSGKTTLLRTIAGLEAPTQGKITINNHLIPYEEKKKIDVTPALRKYRTQLGVVFQSFNLLPHLSALHNISLPLVKVHNWHKTDAEDKAQELLTQFSLGEHGHKHAHQLSGGQKQRIAICRAIASSPEFLLFDEPTSALDPDFIREVLDTIKDLRDYCDFIIVTHHIGFAKSIADHILFLNHGKVIESGSAKDVYENTNNTVVKRFFDNVID